VSKRELKVYEAPGQSSRYRPCIRLQGQWLKNLGFNIGDKITVKEEVGRLIIELTEKDREE